MSFVEPISRPVQTTLQRRLVAPFIVVAVALLAISGLVLHWAGLKTRAWADAETLATARALGLMLDSRFAAAEAFLRGLATSPHLQHGNLAAFERDVTAASRDLQVGAVVLADRDGRMLLHLDSAHPQPLVGLRFANEVSVRAITSGRTAMSGLFMGNISQNYMISVAVPVMRANADGSITTPYSLSVAVRADDLAAALAAQSLPQGSVAAIVDQAGKVVARSIQQGAFVGTAVVPEVRAAIENKTSEVVVRARRIDGVRSAIGLVQAQSSGFWVAIGVSEASFLAQLGGSLLLALLAGISVSVGGLCLVVLLARRVANGIRWLGNLADPEPASAGYRSGVPEIDSAGTALRTAIALQGAKYTDLSRREAKLRGMFDAPLVGMAQFSPDNGKLLLVNERFREILGMPQRGVETEAEGNIFEILGSVFTDEHRIRLREGEASTLTAECLHPGGDTVWVQVGLAMIRDPMVQPPRAVAVIADISGQYREHERQRLLARELSHRAANTLTVVQAALRLTPRQDASEYASAVEARVTALARAHSLLALGGWAGADLQRLFEGEIAPFLPTDTDRAGKVTFDGSRLTLHPIAVQPLAMAIHELATNSTKHGALSKASGQVRVEWLADKARDRLLIRWIETGGPPVRSSPQRRGFGSRLIEATIKGQLGGTVKRCWPQTGLICILELPLARAVAEQPIA